MSSRHKLFFSPSAPKKKKHTIVRTREKHKKEYDTFRKSKYIFSYTACEGSMDPELSLSLLLATKKQHRGELAGHPRGAAPLGLS